MRQWVAMWGFLIIVLIVIAGCASPQNGATTGPQGQNPAQGNNNVKPTSANSWTSITLCTPPPSNPARLQKFFPIVSGWEGKAGMYYPTDHYSILNVIFNDMGSCGSVDELFKSTPTGTKKEGNITTIVNKINNFHGYPAVHAISINNESEITEFSDVVIIEINNQLYVYISVTGGSYYYSLSEAEADIETFASAIDFKGLAASV